jgi:hypothetical protein
MGFSKAARLFSFAASNTSTTLPAFRCRCHRQCLKNMQCSGVMIQNLNVTYYCYGLNNTASFSRDTRVTESWLVSRPRITRRAPINVAIEVEALSQEGSFLLPLCLLLVMF